MGRSKWEKDSDDDIEVPRKPPREQNPDFKKKQQQQKAALQKDEASGKKKKLKKKRRKKESDNGSDSSEGGRVDERPIPGTKSYRERKEAKVSRKPTGSKKDSYEDDGFYRGSDRKMSDQRRKAAPAKVSSTDSDSSEEEEDQRPQKKPPPSRSEKMLKPVSYSEGSSDEEAWIPQSLKFKPKVSAAALAKQATTFPAAEAERGLLKKSHSIFQNAGDTSEEEEDLPKVRQKDDEAPQQQQQARASSRQSRSKGRSGSRSPNRYRRSKSRSVERQRRGRRSRSRSRDGRRRNKSRDRARRSKSRDRRKCYNCDREGHLSRDCPQKEDERQQKRRRSHEREAGAGTVTYKPGRSRSPSPEEKPVKQHSTRGCFNCGEMGHFGRECPKGKTASEQVTVAGEMIGSVIGAGGGTINQMRAQTRCTIKVAECNDAEGNRLITITGTEDNIALAKAMLQESLDIAATLPTDEEGRPIGSSFSTAHNLQHLLASSKIATPHVSSEIVLIDEGLIGNMMGSGGSNINRIRIASRCDIQVAKDPDQNGKRQVTIIGGPDQIALAKTMMLDQNYCSSGEMHTEQVLIQQALIGNIIGSGGQTINRIRQESKCNIKVAEVPDENGNRLISIAGTPENIDVAKTKLQEVLDLAESGDSKHPSWYNMLHFKAASELPHKEQRRFQE